MRSLDSGAQMSGSEDAIEEMRLVEDAKGTQGARQKKEMGQARLEKKAREKSCDGECVAECT